MHIEGLKDGRFLFLEVIQMKWQIGAASIILIVGAIQGFKTTHVLWSLILILHGLRGKVLQLRKEQDESNEDTVAKNGTVYAIE